MINKKFKIPYRPEIDGLRAIAVLSVIIFHFKENLLPGGFLGVDIFFVISGYLITSLIIKELKLSKKFSFSNFFLRRTRRILPAMLFVIFITIIISFFFLLPSEFNELINSSFFGIFFTSNYYFNLIDQSYWNNLGS
ncbi:acyltransferase, partial [Candidatus Pelagibacter sp.]|nr:acyltransferase [Candidatus Pelagibacter sp.]